MLLPRFLSRRQPSPAMAPSSRAFPTQQLFVLALCRLCEPIAFMSIFPYIYYMIKSFHITTSDKEIAIYAGMVTSAFAAAEFSCSVFWGRLSDRVGRKPVLLTGLAGTGLSMLVFGFAPNLTVALIARALGGLLNGNIGVLQTTVAEVVKVEEHRPRAYAIMPFIWCLGSIIGSGLGGSLAEPVKNYPGVFAPGTIFDRFPFLLPNLVSTAVVLLGLVVGVLFLEETHEEKKHRRDAGLEFGRWIVDAFRTRVNGASGYSKLAEASLEETTYLMHDDSEPPDYQSSNGAAGSMRDHDDDPEAAFEKPSARRSGAFTTQVMLNVVAYGILAYHTIAFEQLFPVLLSMEDSKTPPSSVFRFVGGFGLPSSTIGYILSMQGVYQMFAQMVLFPAVVHRFGALTTFRFTALTYPFLYMAVPYLTWLPGPLRMPGLVVVLVWKVTHQALSYPSNMLLLTSSAPSLLQLGVINGVAASAASLSRAVGPTLSGLIQSAGLNAGCLGIPWWSSGAVATIGAGLCLCLQAKARAPPHAESAKIPGRPGGRPATAPRTSDVSEATTLGAGVDDDDDEACECQGVRLRE